MARVAGKQHLLLPHRANRRTRATTQEVMARVRSGYASELC